MEAFIGTLAVAALTGITILAFRNPHTYRNVLFSVLVPLGVLGVAFSIGWSLAILKTYYAVAQFIDIPKRNDALNAAMYGQPLSPKNIIIAFVAVAYLGFLLSLPLMKEEGNKEIAKGEELDKDRKEEQ